MMMIQSVPRLCHMEGKYLKYLEIEENIERSLNFFNNLNFPYTEYFYRNISKFCSKRSGEDLHRARLLGQGYLFTHIANCLSHSHSLAAQPFTN